MAILDGIEHVLVIDWPTADVPETLARAGYTVIVSGGPNPDDYTLWEREGDAVAVQAFGRAPDHTDLVYVYRPIDELAEIVAFAKQLGARVVWLEPDAGHDRDRARSIVEAAGLMYVDEPSIIEAVRT